MIWSTELVFHGGFEQPGLKMLKNSPNLLNQENDEKKTYGIWGYVPFCTLFFQTLTWKTGWNLQKTSPVIFHSCDHTTGARLGIPVIPTPCGMGNSIHSRGHEKSIAVGMLNHLNSGMGIICFFFQSRTETWRIEEIVGPLIPVRYLGVQVQFKVDIFNEKLWKITMFNEKINYKWPFSIAMLVYQRVCHHRQPQGTPYPTLPSTALSSSSMLPCSVKHCGQRKITIFDSERYPLVHRNSEFSL